MKKNQNIFKKKSKYIQKKTKDYNNNTIKM